MCPEPSEWQLVQTKTAISPATKVSLSRWYFHLNRHENKNRVPLITDQRPLRPP
jgi:hypothetical protein